MTPDQLRQIVEDLQPGLLRAEPTTEANTWTIAEPTELTVGFTRIPSGLFVPRSVLQQATPLSQFKVYFTAKEVFGLNLPPLLLLGYVRHCLENVSTDAALFFAGTLLAQLRHPQRSQHDVDTACAAAWLQEPHRTKILNTLRTDDTRVLIPPQAVHLLIKWSLLVSPVTDDPLLQDAGRLPGALFALCELMDGDAIVAETEPVPDVDPGRMGRELMSNQHLNSSVRTMNLMALAYYRWIEGGTTLAGIYREVTGVDIHDLMTLALWLWANSSVSLDEDRPPVLPIELLAHLHWDETRLTRTLELVRTSHEELRSLVRADAENFGVRWSNSPLERFPVTQLDQVLLVLDQDMLARRAFGWLPFWDVVSVAEAKLSGQFRAAFAKRSERYVEEVLLGICADANRLYPDSELRPTLGVGKGRNGQKVADAAIDYGDAWVIIETTTLQLRRQSVAGLDDDSVERDLDKMVEEVEQISATIDSLRHRSHELTGYRDTQVRRYYPVLVMAEGFPVNPITLTALRARAAARGLLNSSDVSPLEVVDTVELEMIEGLSESGGPSLLQLLEGKATANTARSSMEQYVLVELGLQPPRSQRLKKRWDQMTEHLLQPIRELLPQTDSPTAAVVEEPGGPS